ncbi:hypothetical protein NIES4071_103960 (plasmid) [Calothrix sp. NIES-4071]|nr:hypothetical protein NIES4071_103960 [Calothrix sp. NIES-4071]BAZ64383.1 hypothetical protein NIES4105_101160 [Calothrix sp. NIES-4105]
MQQETLERFKSRIIFIVERFLVNKTRTEDDKHELKQHMKTLLTSIFFQCLTEESNIINLINTEYSQFTDEFFEQKFTWLNYIISLPKESVYFQTFLDETKDYIRFISENYYPTEAPRDEEEIKQVIESVNINDNALSDICLVRIAAELLQKIEAKYEQKTQTNKYKPLTEDKLDDVSPIPTAATINASIEANYRIDKWEQTPNNYGAYKYICKSNPLNCIEVMIAGNKDSELLALEAASQVIDKAGLDAAKMQLIFASNLLIKTNKTNSIDSKFTLDGKKIIEQIGWKNRKSVTVSQKLAEIASIAYILGRMMIRCTWIEGKPKGNKVDANVSISPLWVVDVDVKGQMDVSTGKVENPDELYITVNAGPWAEKWLNKVGSKAGDALYQFGWLATEILKINSNHDELALKLAIHLTMMSRIKLWDKNQYKHIVGSLLQAVELEARINSARQNRHCAYELKKRWDKALTLLMDMCWQVNFDNNTYPEWLRPNSKVQKPSDDRRKEKIIDQLLKAKLIIKPPEPIPSFLESKKQPRQLKPTTKGLTKLTPELVRTARENKGWSQRKLAGMLDISQSMLAYIESGKRPINPKTEALIRNSLEIYD